MIDIIKKVIKKTKSNNKIVFFITINYFILLILNLKIQDIYIRDYIGVLTILLPVFFIPIILLLKDFKIINTNIYKIMIFIISIILSQVIMGILFKKNNEIYKVIIIITLLIDILIFISEIFEIKMIFFGTLLSLFSIISVYYKGKERLFSNFLGYFKEKWIITINLLKSLKGILAVFLNILNIIIKDEEYITICLLLFMLIICFYLYTKVEESDLDYNSKLEKRKIKESTKEENGFNIKKIKKINYEVKYLLDSGEKINYIENNEYIAVSKNINLKTLCKKINKKLKKINKKNSKLVIDNFYSQLLQEDIEKLILNEIKYTEQKIILIEKKCELINERKNLLEKLYYDIEDNQKSILIDDKWGNGKTFFIKEFMKKYNSKYEFIYIKIPYFNTKEEFRKEILSELRRVFFKNKIVSLSLTDLSKYFNIEFKGITFNLPKTEYTDIILNLSKELSSITKKIVLILDDVDRVHNKESIYEFLGFLGELNLELNEKITIITISSYSNLKKILELQNNNFLEKYFEKIFYLGDIETSHKIEFFGKESNLENDTINAIKTFEKVLNEKLKIKKADEKEAKNFRNIERLIQRVKRYKINEKDYTDILMIFDIMELLYPNFWEQSKQKNIDVITINKDETDVFYSVIKDFKERIYLEKNRSDISNSYLDFFIYSMFEAIRKYKISEANNNFSYYENIKNMMIKEGEKGITEENIELKDYIITNNIFENYLVEDKKKILEYFMKNNNITKKNFFELCGIYNLRYSLNYKNAKEFFTDLKKNKKEEEELKDSEIKKIIYETLIINDFILYNKMSDINYNSNFEEIKSCLLKTEDKEAKEIKENIEEIFKNNVSSEGENKKEEADMLVNRILNKNNHNDKNNEKIIKEELLILKKRERNKFDEIMKKVKEEDKSGRISKQWEEILKKN